MTWTHPVLSAVQDCTQATKTLYADGPDGYERVATVYSRWGVVDILIGERSEVVINTHSAALADTLARALRPAFQVALLGMDVIVQAPLALPAPASAEVAA